MTFNCSSYGEVRCMKTVVPSDYGRGYRDGMMSGVTIVLAITFAIGLIWWLQLLTRRS